jgi:hypothetical protein
MSMKMSLKSHPNSNLNIGCVVIRDDSPEFSRRVVWSDTSLVSAQTVVNGYFSSHTVVMRARSNFSYAGLAKLLAHVYVLPDICNSFRFSPSITALN